MNEGDSYEKVIELLGEIAKWQRFNGIQTARQILTQELETDKEKIAYGYSDGRPSGEVAKLSNLSDFTIRYYWKKWNTIGIVIPSPKYKGRYERIFSLEDFGIQPPLVQKINSQNQGSYDSNKISDNSQKDLGIKNE